MSNKDVATRLTPLDRKTYLTGLRYYVDACPVQKSKILYGVFPEDLEEVAEMLAEK